MKTYLGDSVYVDCDGYSIILTTENGYGASNTIFLDPEVMKALEDYRKRHLRFRSDEVPPTEEQP